MLYFFVFLSQELLYRRVAVGGNNRDFIDLQKWWALIASGKSSSHDAQVALHYSSDHRLRAEDVFMAVDAFSFYLYSKSTIFQSWGLNHTLATTLPVAHIEKL